MKIPRYKITIVRRPKGETMAKKSETVSVCGIRFFSLGPSIVLRIRVTPGAGKMEVSQ